MHLEGRRWMLRAATLLVICLIFADIAEIEEEVSARNPCDLRILGPVPLFAEYGKSISLNCTMRCPNSAKGWETSLKKTELSEGSYWTWTTVAIGEWVSYPQCYVIDVEGDVSVTNTTIKAYQPPENVSISLPPLMQVGHPYFFTCSVQAVAPMEYFTMFLRKGNTTLHATSYHNVFGNSNFTHSQIIIAQRADHGVEYTCLARLYLTPSGELFEKSASVLVHTFGLPKEPTIDVLDYMELGSVVMATCKVAEAFPLEDVEVALQFDGRDLNVSVTRDNDMLTLEGAVPSDWPGKHMLACQATVSRKGEAKTVERFVYIYSFPEPYLNIQDVNTLAGQDVNITCVLPKSDPREALVVIKGNATLKTCKGRTEISCSHILRIEKEDHNRKITCEATLGFLNIFKTASFVLNVSYAPDFSPSLCQDTVTWMEGAQATFFCEADGNPLSHVECTKDGRDNLITGWSEVTRNQSGVYQCLATNIHGHRVKNVTVRVEYGPEFSDSLCPSSLTWVEGTPYMFSCEADGSPEPHINCSKDDEINAIGHRLEVSRHDSGTYRCKASNRHGVAVKNVTVIVEYAPKFNSSLCSKTHTWVEGAQAIIPSCEAVGNPPPHVQCTNNAGVNVRWNGSEITRNQSGIYQCLATNKHGHDAINIAVTVEYGPAFSEFTCPSTLMWVEGTAATFSCEADGRPTPRVECTKDGGPNAIRHWPTVTRHDAGTYRCNTSNRHGVALKNVAVRVEYKPGFSDTLCPSSVTWVEGTDVTSACQASGNPTPYIECIQEGGTKTLTNWSHITRYDYGTYQCHASNIHGFDVKNVTVTVEYKPEFSDTLCPSSVTWVEGTDATFACQASGNPTPYIECIQEGGTKTFTNWNHITRYDYGTYQCHAGNIHGFDAKNVTVTVEYGPEFTDVLCPSSQMWVEGDQDIFTCNADGNPAPVVKCFVDDRPDVQGHGPGITRPHSGLYQCKASNLHGIALKNVTVVTQYPPKFNDALCLSLLTWTEGSLTTFSCEADGNPTPSVKCTKDGIDKPVNQWLKISRNDSGFYQCIARNSHGSDVWNVEVIVECRPAFTDTLCPSHLTFVEGMPATFSCRSNRNPAPRIECTKDGGKYGVGDWSSIERHASGSYQCIASNKHGSKVRAVMVEYKPDITCIEIIPSESIYRGQKVTLKCQANGFPGPTYHWRTPYNSSLTYSPDNSTVTIMAAEFQHGGVYECEVRNKHGSNRQQKEIHVKDILPIILGVVIGALALVGMAGISLKIYLLHRAEISQEYQVSRAQGVAKEENSTNTYTKMAQFQICDT